MCSKTVQPPGGTVILLLFPEKVCVFMIVWINPCLPVHPAGEPSGEVMRGPSWETGWRKRCRERGAGWRKQYQTDTALQGEKENMHVCREYARDLILHLKLPTTRSNFLNFSSILQHVPWSWFEGMVHLKITNSVTFMFFQNCMTPVENQGEI